MHNYDLIMIILKQSTATLWLIRLIIVIIDSPHLYLYIYIWTIKINTSSWLIISYSTLNITICL